MHRGSGQVQFSVIILTPYALYTKGHEGAGFHKRAMKWQGSIRDALVRQGGVEALFFAGEGRDEPDRGTARHEGLGADLENEGAVALGRVLECHLEVAGGGHCASGNRTEVGSHG